MLAFRNDMREHKMELPNEVPRDAVIGYSRLFQLENWLRELAYLETKAHFGKEWWIEIEQALSRSASPGIPADKSLLRDKKHPHMATPENDPLWFLSFDSLLKIIVDVKLWPLFEEYLTTKDLLQAKFSEILPIRNRVGHNRAVHEDDLDRLRRLLRDLDKGFWRFCTSFNNTHPFVGDQRVDPLYQHFRERMAVDYAEVGPNQWAMVGSTRGMSQSVMVEYSYRPSADATGFPEKGKLYHLTFALTGSDRRAMDFQKILEHTQKYHLMAVYIIMDSFQRSLRVSVPALYPKPEIIAAAEEFYYACGNLFTFSYRDALREQTPSAGTSPFVDYETANRPFEVIAAQWPHFIIPPGHALEVLGPDCPCSFFEA
jgi:hypothetical protein